MKITLISTTETPEDQGIRILSSVLKKENYEVNLIFMNSNKNYYALYNKEILKQLKSICKDSKLIGVNCFVDTKLKAVQIIKYLKKELNSTIVFGGIHVTIAPEECIKDHDILCLGESEEAIVDIANAIKYNKSLENIKNVWIKKKDGIIKNPVRDLIKDLNKIPYPDYDFKNHYVFDKNKIRNFEEKDISKEFLFLSGRGCPYGCDYCSNSTYNNLYKKCKNNIVRFHSVDYIIGFLKQIKSKFKGIYHIGFRDDTFTMRSVEQIKDFSFKYKKEINIDFFVAADARTINEEKVKYLVDAGCTDVNIGIQGSEKVNKNIYHRYIDNKSILNAARIFQLYKNKVSADFDIIATNPFENEEDIVDLIEFIKKLPKPFRLGVNNLTFFIGSKLYNRAIDEGIIKSFKDTGITLEFGDRAGHILLKRKNIYLNTILNLMRGPVTEDKYGGLTKKQLDFLLRKKLIKTFTDKNPVVCIFPYSLMFFDFIKYKILKPIFIKLPYSFKSWYVKKTYEGKIHYSNTNIRQGE